MIMPSYRPPSIFFLGFSFEFEFMLAILVIPLGADSITIILSLTCSILIGFVLVFHFSSVPVANFFIVDYCQGVALIFSFF